MEPVDPNEAPDYYKVIKEPMGELKLKKKNIFKIIFLNCQLKNAFLK